MSKTDRSPVQGQPEQARAGAVRAGCGPGARHTLAAAFGVLSLLLTGSAAAQVYTLQSQFPVANQPLDVAIDPVSSNIVVAEVDQVQTFTSKGTYLNQFGTQGSGVGQFEMPAGVAIDQSNRNLVISDAGDDRVQICTPSGTTYGNCSFINGTFYIPLGVAIDPVSHNIVVADYTDVKICAPTTANYASGANYSCTSFGAGVGPAFTTVEGVAIDPVSHFIVVADYGTNQVRIYDPTGSYMSLVSGAFDEPGSVAIDPTTHDIVVTPTKASAPYFSQVEISAPAGIFLGGFDQNPELGIAIDPTSDNIVTASGNSNQVRIFAPGPSSLPPVLNAPTVSVSFSPATVYTPTTATQMTITLNNPNTTAISGVAFDDIYPAGIAYASSGALQSNSCGGFATLSWSGTATELVSGAIPAHGSCSVVVNLVGTQVGAWTNATGGVISNNAQVSAGASALLAVIRSLTRGHFCPPGGPVCY